MKPETPEQRSERLYRAVSNLRMAGWQQVEGWVFRAPGGTLHDLSTADLMLLSRIEREGLFLWTEQSAGLCREDLVILAKALGSAENLIANMIPHISKYAPEWWDSVSSFADSAETDRVEAREVLVRLAILVQSGQSARLCRESNRGDNTMTEEPIDWEAKAQELRERWGIKWTEWKSGYGAWNTDSGYHPDFANSVDALLAYMPDDWKYGTLKQFRFVGAQEHGAKIFHKMKQYVYSNTPAHALLSACLKATDPPPEFDFGFRPSPIRPGMVVEDDVEEEAGGDGYMNYKKETTP